MANKIVIKIDMDGQITSVHSNDPNCEIEIYNYQECVEYGDASKEELDQELKNEIKDLYEIYHADSENID